MNVSEEFAEEKDFTRPTFERKPGEIGIFVDVYDAVANDKNAFGSRQYFLMTLVDKFYKEVKKGQLYKIKGFFYKRNLLHDITLECFKPGVLLVVNTNSEVALKNLRLQYESEKLNTAFQECFINEKLEKILNVTRLQLKIKLFFDELEAVSEEWSSKMLPHSFDLLSSEKETQIIHLIKRFQQKSFSKRLAKLKDEEATFEQSCLEFLVYLKQYRSVTKPEVNSIQDVHRLCQQYSQMEEAQAQLPLLQRYLTTVAELQTITRDVETHVVFSLAQMRLGCETGDQLRVNGAIQTRVTELKAALRDKAPFRLYSAQVDSYIPSSDRKLWGGLLYLIPAAVALLNDIDQHIDDYFQLGNFNQLISDFEAKLSVRQ